MPEPVRVEHEVPGLTRISRWIFNCYVVHDGGNGRPFVVDPGLPSNGRDAARQMRRLHGLGVEPACVLSTHGHADHVAGITEVTDAGPTPVLLPERCHDYIHGEPAPTPGPREVVKILPVGRDQPFDFGALRELARAASGTEFGRSGMTVPFTPDGYLSDGQDLPDTDGWTVIHGPGHTEDSTCFHHAGTATLISGDTVLTQAGVAWFNPEVTDRVASADTEERLREIEIEHLYPGHGLPVHGHDLLRRARSFRDRPDRRGWAGRVSIALGRW